MKKSGFFAYFRLPKVNFAFSLIELLISLITISVILASLAPVVTHKLKHGGISVGQGKSITNQCSAFSASCQLCTKTECLLCTLTCPDGQYFDKPTCTCKNCISNCNRCTNATACDRCKAGYQKSGNSCSACGAGYYSTEGGACQKCPKGQRSNSTSASTGCTNCTGSEYQDQEGQSSCKTCTSGFVSDSNRACTTCSAGTKWNGSSCENCPAGYYSNSANTTTCTACSSGTYQNETGKTSCKSCSGANEYQDSTGQSSCKTCGANSVPNASHTGCSSTCQTTANCTGNQYLKDNCTCTACPSGQTPNSTKTGCDTVAADCSADGKYYIAATNSCGDCAAGCKTCTSSTACTKCTNTSDYKLVDGVCKAYKYPTSQADCDRISNNTSVYIPNSVADYVKDTKSSVRGGRGICVTRRNAGDLGGPELSSAIKKINADDTKGVCDNDNKQECCWIGYSGKTGTKRTARANATDDNGNVTARYCNNNIGSVDVLQETVNKKTIKLVSAFNYEACNRTVCNWWAANYTCANYAPSGGVSKVGDWALPSKKNLDVIKVAIDGGPKSKTDKAAEIWVQKWSGEGGLQLCASDVKSSVSGSPRCDACTSRCYNGIKGEQSCDPANIWGSEKLQMNTIQAGLGETLKWSEFGVPERYNGSVRCVLEKYIE